MVTCRESEDDHISADGGSDSFRQRRGLTVAAKRRFGGLAGLKCSRCIPEFPLGHRQMNQREGC
jgi:hypothetical protein